MGVRNKFCYVCATAHNKKKNPLEHTCFRNWSGSSSAMESDIIVEGFNQSIKMHGIRYKHFIADGDSSTYANLKMKVEYGNLIQKTECKNHVFKNYSKHLCSAKDDKRIITPKKYLTALSIKTLVDLAKRQLYYNNIGGTVHSLKVDLANGPFHVFGKHENCKEYYCSVPNGNEPSLVDQMKSCGLFQRVEG